MPNSIDRVCIGSLDGCHVKAVKLSHKPLAKTLIFRPSLLHSSFPGENAKPMDPGDELPDQSWIWPSQQAFREITMKENDSGNSISVE